MRSSSLLCRSDDERGRLLDLNRRLRPIQHAAIVLAFAAGLVGVPTFGWLWLAPPAAAAVLFSVVQARLERFRRPEYALLASWLCGQLLMVGGLALASGPRVYLLPGLVLPVMIISVVFPARAVVLGVAFSALLMIASGFCFAAPEVIATPPTLMVPLVVLAATSLLATAVRDSDIASRGAAVVDRLTGTLNRLALSARLAELAHQSSSTGMPVAAIVGDLDRFKTVNDEHGHATGDAVLKGIADRLRGCLGAFEPVYRLGGEEFGVMLAGVDAATAAAVAERLRAAVRERPVEGVAVTISFGVAASQAGGPFDHELVLGRADAALYEAKRLGRDRVCVAPDAPPVAQPPRRRSRELLARPAGEPVVVDAAPARPGDGGNWLIRDPLEREHLLDMLVRNDRVGHVANVLAFGTVAASVPWFGVLPLVTPLLGAVTLQTVEFRLGRFRRPEFALGAAWLFASLAIGAGFAFAREAALCALPMLVLMIPGFGALFPRRGLFVGVAVQALIMTAAGFSVGAQEILADPVILALPLALLGGVGLIAGAVGRSAVDHRGAAVVDGLTGILNRTALETRAAELAHQAAATGEPVAVLIGDVDRFKAINDRAGHAGGDAALREIAGRLRAQLRAFESVYRFGGEEFVVLLPGVDATGAAGVAERLRVALCADPIGGATVTMSFGVAATSPGEAFDLDALLARADAALYGAKRGGRDRVAVAPGSAAAALAA
jgi:diguanylate cyclase (GGDEF)-like protein